MNVQVMSDGADGYRLLSAENELLGWVRGQAIGVSALANDDAVVSAAVRAYYALSDWLERQHLHPLPELGGEPFHLLHDGAHQWLLVGRHPVARLLTETPYNAKPKTHAFEILLKGSISEGMAIHAALVVVGAAHENITAADIAWADRRKAAGARSLITPTTHMEMWGL